MSLIILGGGIAGLSTAIALAERTRESITVLEREASVFTHSSAKNAAIFRPLEVEPALVGLATRGRELLLQLGPELLQSTGLCLIARRGAALEELWRTAREFEIRHEYLEESELYRRAPWLCDGEAELGLFLPDGGVIDLLGLSNRLLRRAIDRGVTVRTTSSATRIETKANAVTGVLLGRGEHLSADRVVIAAGAWAAELGQSCDRVLPLTSYRRHLVELAPAFEVDAEHPVCWDIQTEVYFRPSDKLVLACPGDETEHVAGVPAADPEQIARTKHLVPQLAPGLRDARVVRSWACLRTRTRNGSMAIGLDPEIRGLAWLTGLGGHGMTLGLAAGEMLAELMSGREHAFGTAFAIERIGSG